MYKFDGTWVEIDEDGPPAYATYVMNTQRGVFLKTQVIAAKLSKTAVSVSVTFAPGINWDEERKMWIPFGTQ